MALSLLVGLALLLPRVELLGQRPGDLEDLRRRDPDPGDDLRRLHPGGLTGLADLLGLRRLLARDEVDHERVRGVPDRREVGEGAPLHLRRQLDLESDLSPWLVHAVDPATPLFVLCAPCAVSGRCETAQGAQRTAGQSRSVRPAALSLPTTALTSWARALLVTSSASGVSTTTTSSSPTTTTRRPPAGTTRPPASDETTSPWPRTRGPSSASGSSPHSECQSPTSSQPKEPGTTATPPAAATGSAIAWSMAIFSRPGQVASSTSARRSVSQARAISTRPECRSGFCSAR